MALFRNALNLRTIAIGNFRNCSSSTKLVDVKMNEKTKVATVTMQRAPVNSLNLELLTELSDSLTELENSKARGLILTSSSSTVFSAGLDIMEMYKPDLERCKNFWTTLQDTWLQLYGSLIPTVAVVNGHAPAGGCLLSLCCEYRIMLPNFTIGLNETQLGIVAPSWFIASMRNAIGSRQSEIALTTGRLFKTDDAFKVGLIDEIATDKADGIAKAEKFLSKFEKISPDARGFTKLACRSKDLNALQRNKEQDLEVFLNFVTLPKVQKGLEIYLQSLKRK